MRGENLWAVKHISAGSGSPPHAWGKLGKLTDTVEADGLTPTCVGKITWMNGTQAAE